MGKYNKYIEPLHLSDREKNARLKRLLKLANFNKENFDVEVEYYRRRGCFDGIVRRCPGSVDPRSSDKTDYINHIRERRRARRRQEDCNP